MTLDEMKAAVANARQREHRFIMLVVPREPRGRRMRVAPGLLGEVRSFNAEGHSVVECRVDDVDRFVKRWEATL